jgi:hypothetical protein
MLQHRGLDLDVQLLGYFLAHAVQRALTAGTDLAVLGQVVFDARARQAGRQTLAPPLGRHRRIGRRQAGVGQRKCRISILVGAGGGYQLLGFIEDPVLHLLAGRGEALALGQAQLFFKQLGPLVQCRYLGFQGADIVLSRSR